MGAYTLPGKIQKAVEEMSNAWDRFEDSNGHSLSFSE